MHQIRLIYIYINFCWIFKENVSNACKQATWYVMHLSLQSWTLPTPIHSNRPAHNYPKDLVSMNTVCQKSLVHFNEAIKYFSVIQKHLYVVTYTEAGQLSHPLRSEVPWGDRNWIIDWLIDDWSRLKEKLNN